MQTRAQPCTALQHLPCAPDVSTHNQINVQHELECLKTCRPVVHAPGMVEGLALDRIRPGSHASKNCSGKCCHVRAGPVQIAKVVRRQGGPAQLSGFWHTSNSGKSRFCTACRDVARATLSEHLQVVDGLP